MSDKDRIKQYLDLKGISKNKFYSQTGLSIGFLDSGKSLGVDKARIIINSYPDLCLEWLILGVGPMIREHADMGSTAASAIEANQTVEYQIGTDADQHNSLIDLVRELTAKIEVLAKENGELRGRVNIMERERECMFVHSGGGKLPPPTPTSPPLSPQDLQSPVPSRDTPKSGRK